MSRPVVDFSSHLWPWVNGSGLTLDLFDLLAKLDEAGLVLNSVQSVADGGLYAEVIQKTDRNPYRIWGDDIWQALARAICSAPLTVEKATELCFDPKKLAAHFKNQTSLYESSGINVGDGNDQLITFAGAS